MEIKVNETTSPRQLLIDDEVICVGGNVKIGIYADNNNLMFDGVIVSSGGNEKIGLLNNGTHISFNGNNIDASPIFSKYWDVPTMEASQYWTKDYLGYISDYDDLVLAAPNYVTKHRYEIEGVPVLTKNGNYELFSYHFTPENYSKTIFIQAGIHGNEMDAKQQLLRLCKILVNDINNIKYRPLKVIKENCRLVVIPIVSPYGHDTRKMNVPYDVWNDGINLNRNYDFNHQTNLPSAGVGGAYPFEYAEVRHSRDVLLSIGSENIDFAMDWHDGGNVMYHYWINYCVDSVENKATVTDFVNHLIDKYKIDNPQIDNCRDTNTTGATSGYLYSTLGIEASGVEWIGGYLGYDFGVSQMTQSFEIRANMLLLGYNNNVKRWSINEPKDSLWFAWDYPVAMVRNTLRLEGAQQETKVSDLSIYERWDNLAAKHNSYIIKSEELGKDCTGTLPIHTYTIGNGQKKVLFVGGVMRFGGTHKIDEYAIYLIAEYLCNDYIVSQSRFLQDLKNNYTIIVLPFIDNNASNSAPYYNAGLNNTVLDRIRWVVIEGKTKPSKGIHGEDNHAVKIIKKIIDENTNIKCIVSGGEVMGGYSLNPPDYTTDFETQIVTPRNYNKDTINSLSEYLKVERGEIVSVENTKGNTFGDYAYDSFGIPCFFVQLNVSKKYEERAISSNMSKEAYMYRNYETGRRMANIINLFLFDQN